MKIKRELLRFENFEETSYNAEYDCWGFHGVNVYYDGHYAGEIAWRTEQEMADMTDSEIEEVFNENGILI